MRDTIDGRGSKDQVILFEYLKELYPTQKVYYEFLIYELNNFNAIYLNRHRKNTVIRHSAF